MHDDLYFTWIVPGVVSNQVEFHGNAYHVQVSSENGEKCVELVEDDDIVYSVQIDSAHFRYNIPHFFPLNVQILSWGEAVLFRMVKKCDYCNRFKVIVPTITPRYFPLPEICCACKQAITNKPSDTPINEPLKNPFT